MEYRPGMELGGKRALVTGASSGIGAATARVLAAMGADLVIAARRRDRLDRLAEEIGAAHRVATTVIEADLGQPGAAARLWDEATAAGPIDLLINNAGFGLYQRFATAGWPDQAAMIQLNVTTPVELAHRFVAAALARDTPAWLLNVASIAAFQPVPYMANYAATKAYVLVFSESLALELRGSRVKVTCLCPGGTHTEFSDVAGQDLGRLPAVARASMLSADVVAQRAVRALLRGRRTVVTGRINRFNTFMLRFLPRRVPAVASVKLLGRPPAGPPALPAGDSEE